jgi:LysM repeat protein
LSRLPDGHWSANQLLEKGEGYEVHLVKRGDTLWDISRQYLQNPRLWPQIWEVNPQIVNPHWIYPGDKVLVKKVMVLAPPPEPPAASRPPAAAQPPTSAAPPAGQASAPAEGGAPAAASAPSGGPAETSPAQASPEGLPASAQPSNKVGYSDVYCAGFFVSSEIKPDLVIMGLEEGESQTFLKDRDVVYLNKGNNGGLKPGDEFLVVRPFLKPGQYGTIFKEAENRSKYGFFYKDLGRIRVLIAQDHSSIAQIVFSCEELQVGDILIPNEQRVIPSLSVVKPLDLNPPPSGKAAGKIILSKDFRTLLGIGNVIYLDAGQKKGVMVGDLFRIYRSWSSDNISEFNRESFKENQREFKEVRKILGELVILRVDPNTATALILSSRENINVGDLVEQE